MQNLAMAFIATIIVVGCTTLEKGIVESKTTIPRQTRKSIGYIGKVMVPKETTIKKQFWILVNENGKGKSIAVDSLTYSKIQVKDSIIFKGNRIVKHW
jgi:hypothetical protein